jgi:aminotransferase
MPRPADYMQDVAEATSIKYNNLVYDRKRRGDDVIVLSLGESFFDIPLFPFDDLPMPAIYHYSHSRGLPELRELLAAYYGTQYGVAVDPEQELIVTAGSKIALHMAFMAVLNPGDEVLIHEPAWVSYTEQVRLCHARPVRIPYTATIADYGAFITDRTRAIVVNSPHNPSGRITTAAEWRQLHRLAEELDLYIISDEAYSDFLLDRTAFCSAARFDAAKAHTIVCNSMSKNYGMSGWRVGYLITSAPLLYQILKINQHLMTCPPTILEWYLARHFHDVLEITLPQIRDVVLKRRAVAGLLDRLGVRYLAGEGTFYLFVSIQDSALTSDEFCTRLLADGGVSAVPGIGYGMSCDGFIRVSIGTESLDRIRIGVERIAELIRSTARRSVPADVVAPLATALGGSGRAPADLGIAAAP